MTRKITVALHNISYCGGCDMALVSLGSELLELMEDTIELVYAPLIMSAKDYGDVDLVLLTGSVRNAEDLEEVKKARSRAKYLAVVGACSVFGGVPGLGNLIGPAALLGAVYRDAPASDQQRAVLPSTGLPDLLDDVKPVDSYVKVDFALPGCPPPPDLMGDFLEAVLARLGA